MRLQIILLLFLLSLGSFAQELPVPVIFEKDSLFSDTLPQYIYDNPFFTGVPSFNQLVPLPLADFSIDTGLAKRYHYFVSGINYYRLATGGLLSFYPGPLFSPFIRDGSVFSGADYKIGNKLLLGGFSYGGNSIFSAPFPNRGVNSYDFRGSTLFMEYNISKNFKIGTSVTVTRSPGF